jgi:hypothetical protein
MSPQEAQEIQDIAYRYFLKESGSEQGAQKLMQGLAALVQEQGAKLVHINNLLFLVLVRGKGVIEFHTIGEEQSSKEYANDIVQLTKYVKNIGVKLLYTYAQSRAFDRVARQTGLPIVKTQTQINGSPIFVYAVEF